MFNDPHHSRTMKQSLDWIPLLTCAHDGEIIAPFLSFPHNLGSSMPTPQQGSRLNVLLC